MRFPGLGKLPPELLAKDPDSAANLFLAVLKEMRYDPITVLYTDKPGFAGGSWDRAKRILMVSKSARNVTTAEAYRDQKFRIGITVRHELQHFAQAVLGVLTGAFKDWRAPEESPISGYESRSQVGMPPPGIQDPQWQNPNLFLGLPAPGSGSSQSPRDHALQENEFWTDLTDSIENFVHDIEDVPLENRRRFLRDWLRGDKRPVLGFGDFFSTLYQRDKKRWRAATERFMAEIIKRGINIPGARPGRVAARWLSATYDPESWYYDYEPGMPLQTVLDRWQKDRPGVDRRGNPLARQKAYDKSMPAMLTVRELWPLREYTWTRDNARGGFAKVRGKSVELPGPQKWDALMEDMKVRGWDPTDPLQLEIGSEGGVKVGEGNHRLALAKALGISKVPVWFRFVPGKVSKSKQHDRTQIEVSPKAVKRVVERVKKEPMTPEKQKLIDELMASLGW
jgi:hypothetical protein